jgi:UDP-N-acetylmuramoyl-tripeptide--D-alanyl-D-alanine ligase
MLKTIVQKWLANLSRAIIAKHQPKIIGITGSVGKTSTRDAIYAVVSRAYSARKGNKNFNNELGLPFAVLGVDSPERNVLKWLWVFIKGYLTLYIGSFPRILILEMGVDKPGDMDYLLSIAKPDIAVLTNIGISHYEFFQSSEAVSAEKGKLVSALSESGVAILNSDNELVLQHATKTQAKVITYGFSEESNVRVSIVEEKFTPPVSSKIAIHTNFSSFETSINAVGKPHISSCAAAIAVGLNLNISVDQITKGLQKYKPALGRLNVIKGIKQTIILDDSYNASPASMKEALAILARMPQENKIAVLGDMLELGDLSQQSHEEIGKIISTTNLARLVTVGAMGKVILEAAVSNGFEASKANWFSTSVEAKDFVRDSLIIDSAVLIKGSQSVRMEKISKELLMEPQSAPQMLPRQYGKWLND